MKTFNSVASLKANRLKAGERVARYYYENGDAGYAEGIVKTAAQAAADGDVIDGYYNVTLANGNVWVGEKSEQLIATQWGFSPTDIVDIDMFKAIIAAGQATGRDALFIGSYDFDGQDISDGGLANGQSIGSVRIVGLKGRTTFSNIGSAHYTGYIKYHNISFIDCVQPVYMTGNISLIDVYGCTFTGVRRAIYHNDATVGISLDEAWIRHNTFEAHTEDEFLGCVLLHKAPETRNVLVEHNTFKGITTGATGTNIVLICQIGVDVATATDDFSNNRFNSNTISGCGNSAATYPSTASFGCVIIGRDSEQHDNVIHDNFWFEPLYFKGAGNTQLNNKLRNNQHSGISMKLVTGVETSRESVQDNNVVVGQCDIRPAVRMFGSGRSVNSQVNITATAQVTTQGGLAYQATRSTTTDGELYVTGLFKAPKGIQINTAGDVKLDVNLTSKADGITIIKSTDGNLGDVKVCGKIDCTEQALNINWCERFDTDGLNVTTDYYSGDAVFIQASEYSNLDELTLHLTDRQADGNTVNYAVSLYGEATSLTDVVHKVTDMNFKTDRVLANSPFRFINLGAPTMSVYFSDIDLSMRDKTAAFVARTFTDLEVVKFEGININNLGTGNIISRTLEGSGFTINKFLVNNGIMGVSYNTSDNLAEHTNATVITSRIGNNKTA